MKTSTGTLPALALGCALLLALPVPALGQVYRCRAADGTLVFADDPSRFPEGCQPLERAGRGSLSVVPTTVPEVPPVPSPGTEETSAEEVRSSLLEEARSLAQAYEQAQSERVGSLPPVQVQQALDRMQELEQKKAELLERLATAALPPAEKRRVRGALGSIPSP